MTGAAGNDDEDARTVVPLRLPPRMRMVCFNGVPPFAALYPLDAGPFSAPEWTFSLADDQELPRGAPGDVVDVEQLEAHRIAAVRAGDVEVVSRANVRHPGGAGFPLFAERRDAFVLAHPSDAGSEAPRATRSVSLDPIATWERRLRNNRIGCYVLGSLLVAVVVSLIVLAATDHDLHLGVHVTWGASGGGFALSWRRARRARRALAQARAARGAPARTMTMTLAWTAGHGLGAVALATLAPLSGDADATVARVPLVNVPPGFDPDAPVTVRVHGDLRAPVIETDAGELWPKEFAELAN